MYRDEAIKLLRGGTKGIAEWNEWRSAAKKIPDLIEADLSGADLSEANLSGANLSGVNLLRTNLSGANLSGADLSWANLFAAKLYGLNLSGANLSGADLRVADLRVADLYGAKLSGANLRRADLHGANLGGADLSRADLHGANLSGANLSGVNLVSTNLVRTNLSGADLNGVNLFRTNLSGANLVGVKLDGAECAQAVFADVDFSDATGLELVRHSGPSTIGVDTLFRSKGKIPELFLRGCGLPDELIRYLPSLIGSMSPIHFYSCFISYSSKNRDFAERLFADLQAKGVRCWYDQEHLKIGAKFRHHIDDAIRVHDKLMVVLSEDSIASDWVETEVETALERERNEKRTVLFPIRVDDVILKTPVAWASHVRRQRHIGDFTGWKDHDAYQHSFSRLLRDLNAAESTGTGDHTPP
jgi:uncharacterized protein YjbI with pentapeptide repeats